MTLSKLLYLYSTLVLISDEPTLLYKWRYSSLFYPSDNLENYLLEFHGGNLIGIASNSQINVGVLTSFQYGIQKNGMSLSKNPGRLYFCWKNLRVHFIEVVGMSCMI